MWKVLLVIIPWLCLISLNFPSRDALFHRFRGFPFTWESVVTEGVIFPGQSLPHNINYLILLLNIVIISLIYFGGLFHVDKIIKFRTFSLLHKILFSIELSLVTSMMTLRYLSNNPYTREMPYYQFVYNSMLPVHKIIRSSFKLSYLNITFLTTAFHFILNFVTFFILVNVLIFFLGKTAEKSKELKT